MNEAFLVCADTAITVEYGFNSIKPNGMTYSEYRILRLLADKETLKTIAARRRVSQQAAGKAVKGLVQLGMAKKVIQEEDRRNTAISITTKGKKALIKADKALELIISDVKAA